MIPEWTDPVFPVIFLTTCVALMTFFYVWFLVDMFSDLERREKALERMRNRRKKWHE